MPSLGKDMLLLSWCQSFQGKMPKASELREWKRRDGRRRRQLVVSARVNIWSEWSQGITANHSDDAGQ